MVFSYVESKSGDTSQSETMTGRYDVIVLGEVLIEQHAVRVVRPDPCDVGGIAELKWVAEYADMHGILMPRTASSTGCSAWQHSRR